MSAEREIGYGFNLRSISRHLLPHRRTAYVVYEERQTRPLPLLIPGSGPRATGDRYVLPRGILYGCGRGRLSGFLGVSWVFSGWKKKRKKDGWRLFISTALWKKQTHPSASLNTDGSASYLLSTKDLGYYYPPCHNLFPSVLRGGIENRSHYHSKMELNRAARHKTNPMFSLLVFPNLSRLVNS